MLSFRIETSLELSLSIFNSFSAEAAWGAGLEWV